MKLLNANKPQTVAAQAARNLKNERTAEPAIGVNLSSTQNSQESTGLGGECHEALP
ncbi:hypothetical protein [Planctellipticum variicoloris]|uniref:hypothetical protein n=1 Tax=Planctellipticum variicoloris TaxID=3064265 RepID=UPI0030132912|nr:hypothetical protein SH412_001056 [Planctomycetaceae bacterium SH412]